jgi:hypothetical protein
MEQADSTNANSHIQTTRNEVPEFVSHLTTTQSPSVTTPKQREHKKRNIRYIRDAKTRQVTFCKRRQGLHKKAEELHKITNADVLIITISDTKIMHSFVTPNLKDILNNKELIDYIRAVIMPANALATDKATVDTKGLSATSIEIASKSLSEGDSEAALSSSSSSDSETDVGLSDSDTQSPVSSIQSSPVKGSIKKQLRKSSSSNRSSIDRKRRKRNTDKQQQLIEGLPKFVEV